MQCKFLVALLVCCLFKAKAQNNTLFSNIPFGKHTVGFKTMRLQSLSNKPMLISLWYPAASKTELMSISDVIKAEKIVDKDTDSSLLADFKHQ